MNYARHFYGRHDGIRKKWEGYSGPDRELGFPALKTILDKKPDFFVGTGDNIYYDRNSPGQETAVTKETMRQRWQEQFVRPRFKNLFTQVPTFWEKDDHDYHDNDSHPHDTDKLPSHELGVAMFLEQVPIVDPLDPDPKTYRTYRVNKNLQIWLSEGRDYRSPNRAPDGPDKTM